MKFQFSLSSFEVFSKCLKFKAKLIEEAIPTLFGKIKIFKTCKIQPFDIQFKECNSIKQRQKVNTTHYFGFSKMFIYCLFQKVGVLNDEQN